MLGTFHQAQSHTHMVTHTGAVLFSQWMNPLDGSITLEAVQGQLDSIAELVASELLQDDSRSTRLATTLPYPDLFEKLGTPVLRILDALNAVLYDRLKFKPATPVNYYQVENSFINQVRCKLVLCVRTYMHVCVTVHMYVCMYVCMYVTCVHV